ncbi:MAG: hypothetical protein COA93_00270 [Alphaproteobacteria bacterium]|nr:MAG: hypothetical protein COA93_00270 [Alphaproteobacteria bacterium]
MPKQKNTPDKITGLPKNLAKNLANDPANGLNQIAERYLDLWQDNVRLWARNPDNSDPDTLDKWGAETAQDKK